MYEQYFGLKEKPFNITADPSFLFFSRHHREAFAHLLYGIRERKGFLAITGEIGAGKTTLCKALLDAVDKSTKTAFLLHPALSRYQLLKAMLRDFGITAESNSSIALLNMLNNFLIEQLRQDNNVVLIIDEAQNLTVPLLEQIRLLSNLETQKEKLLQIILVGQPQLREKLKSPKLKQLRQRIGVQYHILPLAKEEIKKYIGHRLSAAGADNCLTFDEGAARKIFQYSQGVPRMINILCDKILLAAYVQETRLVNKDLVSKCIKELE